MGKSYVQKIQRDLTGNIIIITGANTGIGQESARTIAKLGGTVILACRSEERTKPILEELQKNYPNTKPEFIKLDLSDLESVIEFSNQFSSKYDRLDILLNNAGIMLPQERKTTKQNFEIQLGTNHFGHFVLTNRLLPLLKKTPQSRVINVSSLAHEGMMGGEKSILMIQILKKKYHDASAYCQSKLANIYFTKYLQNHLKAQNVDMKVVSLHPGVIKSDLTRHLYEKANFAKKAVLDAFYAFQKDTVQGAQTQLYCCVEQYDKLVEGGYYSDIKIKSPSKTAQNTELAEKFWRLSNEMVKQYLIEW